MEFPFLPPMKIFKKYQYVLVLTVGLTSFAPNLLSTQTLYYETGLKEQFLSSKVFVKIMSHF